MYRWFGPNWASGMVSREEMVSETSMGGRVSRMREISRRRESSKVGALVSVGRKR